MIKVCIEVEAGSREKHVFNEATLEHTGVRRAPRPYPYAYGFVLGTRAADGDGVDCYIITRDSLKPGAVVECELIGLLEMDEAGEVDHKALAAISGQAVEAGSELLQELRDFIRAIFSRHPDVRVTIGGILPREAAEEYVQARR